MGDFTSRMYKASRRWMNKIDASDIGTFERQYLRIVTEKLNPVSNDLTRNLIKVADFVHAHSHEDLLQANTESIALLALELIGRAECGKNGIICNRVC